MDRLKDQVALVTGASRGIGRAVALMLASEGACVGLFARNAEDLERVAMEIRTGGARALVLPGSVSEQADVDAAVKRLVQDRGRLDILVNNAGITRDALLMRMKDDAWSEVIDVNVGGAFRFMRAVTRQMLRQKNGRIINIMSVVGLVGQAGQANYAASKAALGGLTKAAARELASRGITVNAVAPGAIETDMLEKLPAEARESIKAQIPLLRFGRPEEVAAAVCFLASPLAAYVSGEIIRVDGGLAM